MGSNFTCIDEGRDTTRATNVRSVLLCYDAIIRVIATRCKNGNYSWDYNSSLCLVSLSPTTLGNVAQNNGLSNAMMSLACLRVRWAEENRVLKGWSHYLLCSLEWVFERSSGEYGIHW